MFPIVEKQNDTHSKLSTYFMMNIAHSTQIMNNRRFSEDQGGLRSFFIQATLGLFLDELNLKCIDSC